LSSKLDHYKSKGEESHPYPLKVIFAYQKGFLKKLTFKKVISRAIFQDKLDDIIETPESGFKREQG